MYKIIVLVTLFVSLILTGGDIMALEIKSPAFEEGMPIPPKYTCKGEDVSPPLEWSGLPDGTESVALICDDPDAPSMTWVHWVIYNIPVSETGLAEKTPKEEVLPGGAMQGMTDFRRIGYGGPCPPPGGPHRYYFKLYALDSEVDLEPGATKEELLEAMEGHILEEASLMGTFKR